MFLVPLKISVPVQLSTEYGCCFVVQLIVMIYCVCLLNRNVTINFNGHGYVILFFM